MADSVAPAKKIGFAASVKGATSSGTPHGATESSLAEKSHHDGHHRKTKLRAAIHEIQRYSVPLLLGIVVALIWINVHPESYNLVVGSDHHLAWKITGDWMLMGHPITIHFLINDIFMVFFFGIAAKEVTESCLPGGSLNPPRKALSPLVATLGGVSGPIAVYMVMCYVSYEMGAFDEYYMEDQSSSGSGSGSGSGNGNGSGIDVPFDAFQKVPLSMVMNGWGVPTATDISLAWMVAVQVFPFQHPAIDFLLLLAVADDAIGLIIIAAAYGDPDHPVQPIYLLAVFGGAFVSYILRRVFRLQHWSPYILLGGACSWFGLVGARLHPALALCFVVPFLPSKPPSSKPNQLPTLQVFEHDIKLVVDFGMFFFTLANAGVEFNSVGALTGAVMTALIAGKIIGVTFFVVAMDKVKCAPLHPSIKLPDVAMISSMASIGLTVALFVSGEAFPTNKRLEGESKLGALISGAMGLLCVGLSKLACWKRGHADVSSTHRSLSATADDVTLPPRPIEADQADQQFYKHLIRAHDGAFTVPFHQAEKPGLLDIDHDRARTNWRESSQSVLSSIGFQKSSTRITPIGLTKEDTQKNVLSAFSKKSIGAGVAVSET